MTVHKTVVGLVTFLFFLEKYYTWPTHISLLIVDVREFIEIAFAFSTEFLGLLAFEEPLRVLLQVFGQVLKILKDFLVSRKLLEYNFSVC